MNEIRGTALTPIPEGPVLSIHGEKEIMDLHAYLARELRDQLVNGSEIVDKKGKVTKVAPTPALLNVIRQFLRDNGVQAKPEQNDNIGDLLSSLPQFEPDNVRPNTG